MADETQKSLVPSVASPEAPATKDSLGYEPYLQAIAAFIVNKETRGPLTISVEGNWGAGKTSFMKMLQSRLPKNTCKTVWFNAWRHQNDEALWASFALQFTQQLLDSMSWRERFCCQFMLFWNRFKWSGGWTDVFRLFICLGLTALFVSFVLSSLNVDSRQNLVLSSVMAVVVTCITFYHELKKHFSALLGNPIAPDLSKFVDKPEYAKKVAFLEQFHTDFAKCVASLAQERKVVVFIDDLDRAVAPKSADLVESINLMMADTPNVIFVIGLDRQVVAAAVAAKHEKTIKYLAPATRSQSPSPATEQGGAQNKNQPTLELSALEFGFEYIKKFVHLPFVLPRMRAVELPQFLQSIFPQPEIKQSKLGSWIRQLAKPVIVEMLAIQPPQFIGGSSQFQAPPIAKIPAELERELELSSARMLLICEVVAAALDWNPRRIKQFINLFRLHCFIAQNTGLFDREKRVENPSVTLEQLAKFTCIGLRWPGLIAALDRYPYLFRDLLNLADNDSNYRPRSQAAVFEYWSNRVALIDLLKASTNDRRSWMLNPGVINALLKVCPSVDYEIASDPIQTPPPVPEESRPETSIDTPVGPNVEPGDTDAPLPLDVSYVDAPPVIAAESQLERALSSADIEEAGEELPTDEITDAARTDDIEVELRNGEFGAQRCRVNFDLPSSIAFAINPNQWSTYQRVGAFSGGSKLVYGHTGTGGRPMGEAVPVKQLMNATRLVGIELEGTAPSNRGMQSASGPLFSGIIDLQWDSKVWHCTLLPRDISLAKDLIIDASAFLQNESQLQQLAADCRAALKLDGSGSGEIDVSEVPFSILAKYGFEFRV